MESSLRRRAKEAYIFADEFKAFHFDSEANAVGSLEDLKRHVGSWADAQIDDYIGAQNSARLDFFNRAEWEFVTVELRNCVVWDGGMGGREWAKGFVPDVAERFKSLEPKESRIWQMREWSEFYSWHLPIITFARSREFAIDDGSHRAVAIALANRFSTLAWVGRL